jgi:hypothetical protein
MYGAAEFGPANIIARLCPRLSTDQAALDEALKTIREEGIKTFLSGKTDVMH